jgi:FAD/FMN-containing dehydrogenase
VPTLTKKDKTFLDNLFGERVTYDKTERKLYGHDIAAIPSLVKPLVGDTTPDGVVQPTGEEQLVEFVTWAAERRIPLTPRGKGSAGYGGAIPVKNGIVVDFYFMKDLLEVDEDALTCTTQPGITWEQLDRKLKKRDLTLRLYPTSYPSSSVGGWLAQGGAGIGSFEYGWFKENVVSARVVMPGGEVREFSGVDLGLIADAEGITGIISQVTFKIRKLEEEAITAIACPDANDMQHLVQQIVDSDLPVWSVMFINPRMAELKNKSPLMEHMGHPV